MEKLNKINDSLDETVKIQELKIKEFKRILPSEEKVKKGSYQTNLNNMYGQGSISHTYSKVRFHDQMIKFCKELKINSSSNIEDIKKLKESKVVELKNVYGLNLLSDSSIGEKQKTKLACGQIALLFEGNKILIKDFCTDLSNIQENAPKDDENAAKEYYSNIAKEILPGLKEQKQQQTQGQKSSIFGNPSRFVNNLEGKINLSNAGDILKTLCLNAKEIEKYADNAMEKELSDLKKDINTENRVNWSSIFSKGIGEKATSVGLAVWARSQGQKISPENAHAIVLLDQIKNSDIGSDERNKAIENFAELMKNELNLDSNLARDSKWINNAKDNPITNQDVTELQNYLNNQAVNDYPKNDIGLNKFKKK